ncbi:myelin and lymphocyte protein isoform X1 [Denticeps clupeoides]|uniref:MARVEL domain-containing protein n=1 Tax=Denticeps clupeoides TaxID=299321 RepID=A0AAY4EZ20_9TELE|nr:myelin and lymphocyte protein isoform X1 [Denticeps clupeoides]
MGSNLSLQNNECAVITFHFNKTSQPPRRFSCLTSKQQTNKQTNNKQQQQVGGAPARPRPRPGCVRRARPGEKARASARLRYSTPVAAAAATMAAATAQPMGNLPSGLGICTTAPDIFYLPELVFGGLVWILVASTHVIPTNPQGWVMFVSIFCFVMTFLWLIIFAAGGHKNHVGWAAADFVYHFLAALFYLSASVPLGYITIGLRDVTPYKNYQIDIAAVVFSYVATLFYFIHCILSAVRWRSF